MTISQYIVTCKALIWFIDKNRGCIPAREKLAATLRLLTTGESVKSIHMQFRHGQETVRRYIPEVCQAIYDVLADEYMKVQ